MSFDSIRFWLEPRWKYLLIGVAVAVFLVGGVVLLRNKKDGVVSGTADVTVPTIINGELVLPKLATGSAATVLGGRARLGVVSANLIGVQDQSGKLSAIRILGEVSNVGEKIVDGISPVVRFIDSKGNVVAQKIGRPSSGWEFFGVLPGEKTFYDVTVDAPPQADKLEIVLNTSSGTDSVSFDQLKIASRSMEVKMASDSAGQKVAYYSVSGRAVNTLSDSVSNITIYSWARNEEGRVFAFGRLDFKNDLLAAGDKIDFRVLLLPLKIGEEYDSYEVAAWGKRYRLNL